MKPSHLTTPRTMAETTFVTGYYTAQPRMDREDRIVLTGSAVVAAVLVVLAVAGLL